MKKLFFLVCIVLGLTSCFEVIEEVSLLDNGEGDFKVTLNLSKSKGQVETLLSLDTINGKHIPNKAEISHAIDQIAKELEAIPGIDHVESKKDFENFILSLGYHFQDVATLNKSIQSIIEHHAHNHPNLSKTNFYKQVGNTFIRSDEFNFSVLMKNFSSDTKVLETSTYTCIYRFPKTIHAQSNPNAKTSKSKKASMHKIRAAQLIKNHTLIENKITCDD